MEVNSALCTVAKSAIFDFVVIGVEMMHRNQYLDISVMPLVANHSEIVVCDI